MSAPVAFIAAPGVLTQASDAVESATTDSLQRAARVVPNARPKLTQNHVKQPVIPYLRKRAHSTARIAARSQMREKPVKVPYISKINILVVTMHSFTLLISCCYSVFILSVDFARGVFFWRCSTQRGMRSKQARAAVAGLPPPGRCRGER